MSDRDRYGILADEDELSPGLYETNVTLELIRWERLALDQRRQRQREIVTEIIRGVRSELAHVERLLHVEAEHPYQIVIRDVTYTVPTIIDGRYRMNLFIRFEVIPPPSPRPVIKAALIWTVLKWAGLIGGVIIGVRFVQATDSTTRRINRIVEVHLPRVATALLWGGGAYLFWLMFRRDIKEEAERRRRAAAVRRHRARRGDR